MRIVWLALVSVVLLPLSTILVPKTLAYFNTPVQMGTLYDTSTLGSPGTLAAVYGSSTQYSYNAPATETLPQFYLGLEAHGKNYPSIGYGAYNLRITLTGTDPKGAALSDLRFQALNFEHSPESGGAQQQVLSIIWNFINANLPYGIGVITSGITDALCCVGGLTHGSNSATSGGVWVDWTAQPLSGIPLDSGLFVSFLLGVDSSLQGTYIVHISYHVTIVGTTTCCQFTVAQADVSDTVYYCYITCSGGDFSISSSPTSLTVNGGSSSSMSTIILGSVGSFSGPVSVASTASDPSLQTSLGPQTVTVPSGGSASSTLFVSAPLSTCNPGSFTVSVTGANGIGHFVNIPVTETCPPDFSISASPTSLCIYPGYGYGSLITIQSIHGFSGSVSLSSSISPSGISSFFTVNPISVASGGSSSSTIDVTSSTSTSSQGSYTVTATATGGGLSHSATISVTVSYTTCPFPGGGSGGGGGGSVASGSLITLADGTRIPVQDIRVGDQVIVYNVPTGYQTVATVYQVLTVDVNSTLTIHTTAGGSPFRADANPHMKLWVQTSNGAVEKPITTIQPGDQIYNYDIRSWVSVTDVTITYGGLHTMYDLLTTPNFTNNGLILEYIANGYPDCPARGCKT